MGGDPLLRICKHEHAISFTPVEKKLDRVRIDLLPAGFSLLELSKLYANRPSCKLPSLECDIVSKTRRLWGRSSMIAGPTVMAVMKI